MSDPPEPDATGAYQPTPPTGSAGERFAPGALLAGRYHIVAALGKGGMGEVYRARDSRLDREVALKLLPGAYSTDADRLRRFEQEARATGKLNHPNVLTVYDVGIHEAHLYIVMELLEGEELRAVEEGCGFLPPSN